MDTVLPNAIVANAAESVGKGIISQYVTRTLLRKLVQILKRAVVKISTVAVSRSKAQVLLQTAWTYAYTADNELIPVRILMGVGSQRSYLSNALKTKLILKPLRQEHLTLNTFGNEQFNKRRCDLITVRLQAKHGEEVEISALSFPAICSPL